MSKSFRTSLILVSLVLLLLGLALIIWPAAAQRVVCYVAGALCAALGMGRIAAQWRLSRDWGFQLSYLLGVLITLLGVLLIVRADAMIAIFGALVGLALAADSVVKLQMSLRMRAFGLPRWKALAIGAAALFVLGVVLLFDPFAGATAMTVVMGVMLVLDAAADIWTVVELRGRGEP